MQEGGRTIADFYLRKRLFIKQCGLAIFNGIGSLDLNFSDGIFPLVILNDKSNAACKY
jgi:hypothetical protein